MLLRSPTPAGYSLAAAVGIVIGFALGYGLGALADGRPGSAWRAKEQKFVCSLSAHFLTATVLAFLTIVGSFVAWRPALLFTWPALFLGLWFRDLPEPSSWFVYSALLVTYYYFVLWPAFWAFDSKSKRGYLISGLIFSAVALGYVSWFRYFDFD